MSASVDPPRTERAVASYTPDSTPPVAGDVIRGRRRVDWRSILLEAFFVVLGIVLALGANEWRQAQIDQRNAQQALASIREEMKANRTAVLRSAEYHIQITDSLTALSRRSGTRPATLPDSRLFSRGFINPAPLLSTAWEAAGAVDAVRHMPYADVLVLARMYERQTRYTTQSELGGGVILQCPLRARVRGNPQEPPESGIDHRGILVSRVRAVVRLRPGAGQTR